MVIIKVQGQIEINMLGKHIRIAILMLLAVVYLIWKIFPETYLQSKWNILETATIVLIAIFIAAILFRPFKKKE